MIGRTLKGRYRLLREAGAGSMGTVFEATDTRGGSSVAVKVIHRHLAQEPLYVERFRREAQIAARLDSRHLAAVHDFGTEDGLAFAVFEFVRGRTLRALLRDDPAPAPEAAAAIALQIARAIEESHSKGVLHRDVKPENIIVEDGGRAVLTDFGVAQADIFATLGGIVGTPAYLAPEAGLGRFDARSDLYSLGAILFEMLSASPPVLGGARPESPDRGGSASALWDLALDCISVDPQDRPPSAATVRERLEAFLEHEDASGLGVWALPVPGLPAGVGTGPRIWRKALAGTVAGGAAGLALLGVLLTGGDATDRSGASGTGATVPAGTAPAEPPSVRVVDGFESEYFSLMRAPEAANISGGELRVARSEVQPSSIHHLVGTFADGAILVDARVVLEAPGGAASVGCRASGEQKLTTYRMRVEPGRQLVRIDKLDGGLATGVGVQQVSADVKSGTEWNRLQLTCNGERITGSVNGVEVLTLEDDDLTEGEFWVGVGADANERGMFVEAAFDNLMLRSFVAPDSRPLRVAFEAYYEEGTYPGRPPSFISYSFRLVGLQPGPPGPYPFEVSPAPGGRRREDLGFSQSASGLVLHISNQTEPGIYRVDLTLPDGRCAAFTIRRW